jgi:hypothetical protein
LAVTADPTINQFMWLHRLQEPGRAIGIAVWHSLYGRFGYSTTWVGIGSMSGFLVLIAAWSAGVFIVLQIFGLVKAKSR